MKGGTRSNNTSCVNTSEKNKKLWNWLRWRVVREDGKWWGREVVTMGNGDEGEWWGREVVPKGSGEEGRWCRREVVRKGSGVEGEWWRREVVKKGSGEEGEWWWREVVRKGSGGEGKWWGREVVKKGSGDEGKWRRREVVTKGSGEEGCVSWSCGCRSHWNGPMNVAWAMLWGGSQSTKPRVFPCKVAAGDDERYLVCAAVAAAVVPDAIGSSYGFCKNLCSCVRSSMCFLKLWLQIALDWLHDCCMGYVVGRKPEHETSCFSV